MKNANRNDSSENKNEIVWQEYAKLAKEAEVHIDATQKVLKKMFEAAKKQPNISQIVKSGLRQIEENIDDFKAHTVMHIKLQEKLKSMEEPEKNDRCLSTNAKMSQATLEVITPVEKKNIRIECTATPGDDSFEIVESSLSKTSAMNTNNSTLPFESGGKGSTVTYKEKLMEGKREKTINKQESTDKQADNTKIQGDLTNKTGKLDPKKIPQEEKKEINKPGLRENRTKRRNQRPNALLIKVTNDLPYTEVLQKLKLKVDPSHTNTEIRAIKKTTSGDVMLEMSDNAKIPVEFKKEVEEAIGADHIRELTPRESVEIRDLDYLVTAEEVSVAIKHKVGNPTGEIKVKLTKPNSRYQIRAIVELPTNDAQTLIAAEKLRVGWINCRLRRHIDVPRCYRCLGYGHLARQCTGEDRTKKCYKCQEPIDTGHSGANCTATPKCPFCKEVGEPSDHIAGRKGCNAYRRALEHERAKKS